MKFARRSILGYGLGSASAVLLGPTSRSRAAAASYKATMDSKSEVPPNQSPATGTATVTYDDSTKTVTWQGTFTGLSGPATAAHIHGPAAAGKNAGVLVPLGNVPKSPLHGSATLTAEQEQQLAAGELYVNVHTKNHPSGAIRGQLTKAP